MVSSVAAIPVLIKHENNIEIECTLTYAERESEEK